MRLKFPATFWSVRNILGPHKILAWWQLLGPFLWRSTQTCGRRCRRFRGTDTRHNSSRRRQWRPWLGPTETKMLSESRGFILGQYPLNDSKLHYSFAIYRRTEKKKNCILTSHQGLCVCFNIFCDLKIGRETDLLSTPCPVFNPPV